MIKVVGIGPGGLEYLLPIAQKAIEEADIIIGYHYYFQFIQELIRPDTICIGKELSEEEKRAEIALEKAIEGYNVVVIGSGDAGIYSMASIVYQKVAQSGEEIELETIPGISAFVAAGSKLGAVLGHDFCCISLSDLMTPWKTIQKRIEAAAWGDFVTSIYNPRSVKRYWQLGKLKAIFLEHRSANTPVAICFQLGRPDEKITLTTLAALDIDQVDMFSLVVIGNSQTFTHKNHLITPRGYLDRKPQSGPEIQEASFNEIIRQLEPARYPADFLWAAVRCIHTAGDHAFINYIKTSAGAIAAWHDYLAGGGKIVTDVTMVKAGITRAFTELYGNEVICLLNTEETVALAARENLTRSQAGIRLAALAYPDALFVIGNAPTALIEIADQVKLGKINPAGIIAAPVGFINVIESKERVKALSIPYALVEDQRGGSNFAAALVNAAFSLPEHVNYFKPART